MAVEGVIVGMAHAVVVRVGVRHDAFCWLEVLCSEVGWRSMLDKGEKSDGSMEGGSLCRGEGQSQICLAKTADSDVNP